MPALQKHQIPPGDPSEEAFAESLPQENSTVPRTRQHSQKMPGTSVAMPQLPSAFRMFKVTIMAHWRECLARSSTDVKARLLWLFVRLPMRCMIEVLTQTDILPGTGYHLCLNVYYSWHRDCSCAS
jgi:hypothetical protein